MAVARETAYQTLDSLEQRLQRLHFLLYGDSPEAETTTTTTSATPDQTQSIAARLQALEKSFDSVLTQSKDAQDLVKLQSQHSDGTPDITQNALTSLVLSHAPSYQATAARLISLQDLPAPDASSSAALIKLEPRLQKALDRQEDQQAVISQLRQQSVNLIATWYELGIVAMDDCWTEWESRLMDAESRVRRSETEKRRQDEGL